jgi:DNA mismatch repair ATPase MutS
MFQEVSFSVSFQSILFVNNHEGSIETARHKMPPFFEDLNLDQLVDAITAGREEYDLKPFYCVSLHDASEIRYRQEVMRDLENDILLEKIKLFAENMRIMRRYLDLSKNIDHKYYKEGWFLEAAEVYCEAITSLVFNLALIDLKSQGFLEFRNYLEKYYESSYFTSLLMDTKKIKLDLATVKYCININGNCIKVFQYKSEIDYSSDVMSTFMKFKQGAARDYKLMLPVGYSMNHVEAEILNLVAKLYPDIFLNLDNFCARYAQFVDKNIAIFEREIQFYLAYLEYVLKLRQAGLKFCYPQISDKSKEIFAYEVFDLVLAKKLVDENSQVVCNDFYLKDNERILVVSGPNQGGKTTFARTFGQLHFLASIGCLVPGREARLFLYDSLFTHFEKEENIKNLQGKLKDDLVRIHDILTRATSNSIIIMNEIFASTTLKDAVLLGKRIMRRIITLDLLCVWVTFVDELASLSEKTVSMVSTVVPGNPSLRTFKIVRRPADGLAYALSIAEKYRLTYGCLMERIPSVAGSH